MRASRWISTGLAITNSITLTELSSLTDIAKGNLLPILNDLVIGGHVERCAKRGREVPYRLREGGKKW